MEQWMSLREKILAANDRPIIRLNIPEWGCDVFVRAMSGAQRDVFEQFWSKRNEEGTDEARARLAAMVLCEEDGKSVFETVGDGTLNLKDKSATALDRIFNTVLDQNKIGAGGIEEAAKNSESAQPAS
jgi:hypothetical protein